VLDTLAELFDRHAQTSGILGVAVGRKEVDGETADDNPYAVSFFVHGKEPRRGARLTLRSGRRVLPRRVDTQDGTMPTDVVDVGPAVAPPRRGRLQATRFTAGGPVSNLTDFGTFGCLVRRAGSPFTFALTNRHVAIDTGEAVFFPSPSAPNPIAAVTRDVIGLLADEAFSPLVDEPNAYFDVDAALVQIPENAMGAFSPGIPTLGVPSGVFQPDFTSPHAYLDSVIGQPVSAWNWNSKRREGAISHAWYTARRIPGRPILIYSFLIRPVDGTAASAAMDSGKAWVRRSGGTVSLVALHQGSIDPGASTRFAVATEMASLARLWRLAPAS
jgi:hypothetical protein